MRVFLTSLVALLIICYPFAVYFGATHLSPRYLALAIIAIFVLRALLVRQARLSTRSPLTYVVLVGISVCLLGFFSNDLLFMKLYPFFINLTLLSLFFYSVCYPPTVIERIARLSTPDLTQAAIRYTKKVTLAWCVFFIVNGSVALWTACFSSMKVWAFYNGLLAYTFIGLFFAIEFIIRYFVKKHVQ